MEWIFVHPYLFAFLAFFGMLMTVSIIGIISGTVLRCKEIEGMYDVEELIKHDET